MNKTSLWEFRGNFNEDEELEALEIREIIELPEIWQYAIFLQEQYEQYMKGCDVLTGMG